MSKHKKTKKRKTLAKVGSKQKKRATRKPRNAVRQARTKVRPLREIPVQLDYARRHFMVTGSVAGAARSMGVSPSRLRRLIRDYRLAKWDAKKRRWTITDRLTREVGIASNGEARTITVRGFSRAQLAKSYTAAVKRFLETNDASVLVPFQGKTVTDIRKQKHLLETRPNVLLRLANTGSDAEMKIYRLND